MKITEPKARRFAKIINLACNGTTDSERLNAISKAAAILSGENINAEQMFITPPDTPVIKAYAEALAAEKAKTAAHRHEQKQSKKRKERPKKPCPCCDGQYRSDRLIDHIAVKHPEYYTNVFIKI